MNEIEAELLYHRARSRHVERRDQALRLAAIQQGHSTLPRPYVRRQLRAWFDIWESYLWETYKHERDCALQWVVDGKDTAFVARRDNRGSPEEVEHALLRGDAHVKSPKLTTAREAEKLFGN